MVVVAAVVEAAGVAAILPAECHAAASLVAEWPRAASLVAECAPAARVGAVLIGTDRAIGTVPAIGMAAIGTVAIIGAAKIGAATTGVMVIIIATMM